jgi:hypothetical protein
MQRVMPSPTYILTRVPTDCAHARTSMPDIYIYMYLHARDRRGGGGDPHDRVRARHVVRQLAEPERQPPEVLHRTAQVVEEHLGRVGLGLKVGARARAS